MQTAGVTSLTLCSDRAALAPASGSAAAAAGAAVGLMAETTTQTQVNITLHTSQALLNVRHHL